MRLPNRRELALFGLLLAVILVIVMDLINEAITDALSPVVQEAAYIYDGRVLADVQHHRDLARALGEDRLTWILGFNRIRQIGSGFPSQFMKPGEGTIFKFYIGSDYPNQSDSGLLERLVLYVPAGKSAANQEFQFENGGNAEGALLFTTYEQPAWNQYVIGYPMRGTVRITRESSDFIRVGVDVEYRYARHGWHTLDDGRTERGWKAEHDWARDNLPDVIRFPTNEPAPQY